MTRNAKFAFYYFVAGSGNVWLWEKFGPKVFLVTGVVFFAYSIAHEIIDEIARAKEKG